MTNPELMFRIRSAPLARGLVRAGQLEIRRNNLALIMESLAASRQSSRAKLSLETGLTKATVSALVADLIGASLIREVTKQNDGRLGRPATVLEVSGETVAAIGLEINVDCVGVCLMDLSGTVRKMEFVEHQGETPNPQSVVASLMRMGNSVIRQAARDGLTLVGVAVAVPGLVDLRNDRLCVAPNLGWYDVPLQEMVEQSLAVSLPVTVDNDANLGALAMQWQSDPPLPADFVYVSGSVGVGAGIVIGDHLFRGAHGFGGEFGHMTVDLNGERCGCGTYGCLETMAGQARLRRVAGLDDASEPWLDLLLGRLEASDQTAVAAVDEVGRSLGIALASIVNLFDPAAIVLGGYFAPLTKWLQPTIEAALDQRVLGRRCSSVTVIDTRLGRSAAVVGGAAHVLSGVLADPLKMWSLAAPVLSRH